MSGTMTSDPTMSLSMKNCIELCWQCRTECIKTLYAYCLPQGGPHASEDHVRTMTDCIEICQVAADFMVRRSYLHSFVCDACASICSACATSCEEAGEGMEKCADLCRQCAASCRDMALA